MTNNKGLKVYCESHLRTYWFLHHTYIVSDGYADVQMPLFGIMQHCILVPG